LARSAAAKLGPRPEPTAPSAAYTRQERATCQPRVSHVSATERYARHARFYPSVLVAECEEAGLSAARDKFWLARTSDDWRVAMKRLGGLLPRVVIV
jgi:hypothetical protein